MNNQSIPKSVEGFFKKMKGESSVKIFTKYTQRYFDVKRAYNVNILEEYTAHGLLENKEDPFKDKYPKGWEHAIVIETTDRSYKLFAKDYNFKELFLFVLKKLIHFREDFEERNQAELSHQDKQVYMNTEMGPILNKYQDEGKRPRAESVSIRQTTSKNLKQEEVKPDLVQDNLILNQLEKQDYDKNEPPRINRQSTSDRTESIIEDPYLQNRSLKLIGQTDASQILNSNDQQENEAKATCQPNEVKSVNMVLKELKFEVADSRQSQQTRRKEYQSLSPDPHKIKSPTTAISVSRKNAQQEQGIQDAKKPHLTSIQGGGQNISQSLGRKQKRQQAEVVAELNQNISEVKLIKEVPQKKYKDKQATKDPIEKIEKSSKEAEDQSVGEKALMIEKEKLSKQIRKRYKKRASVAVIDPHEQLAASNLNHEFCESMPRLQESPSKDVITGKSQHQLEEKDPEENSQTMLQKQSSQLPMRTESNNSKRLRKPPKNDKTIKKVQDPLIILGSQSPAAQNEQKSVLQTSSKTLLRQKSMKEKIDDVIDDRGSDLSDQEIISGQFINFDTNIRDADLSSSNLPFNKNKSSQLSHQKEKSQISSPVKGRAQSYSDVQSVFQSSNPYVQQTKQSFLHQIDKGQSPKKLDIQQAISPHQALIFNKSPNMKSHSPFLMNNSAKIMNLDGMNQWNLLQNSEYLYNGQNGKGIKDIRHDIYSQNISQSNLPAKHANLLSSKQGDSSHTDTFYQSANDKTQSSLFHADDNTRQQLLNKWDNKFGQSTSNCLQGVNQQQLNESSEWDSQKEEEQVNKIHNHSQQTNKFDSSQSQPYIFQKNHRRMQHIASKTHNEHSLKIQNILMVEQPQHLVQKKEEKSPSSFSRKRQYKTASQKQSLLNGSNLMILKQPSPVSSQAIITNSQRGKLDGDSTFAGVKEFKSTYERYQHQVPFEEGQNGLTTESQKQSHHLSDIQTQENLNTILTKIKNAQRVQLGSFNTKAKSCLNSSLNRVIPELTNTPQNDQIQNFNDEQAAAYEQKYGFPKTQKSTVSTNRNFLAMHSSNLNNDHKHVVQQKGELDEVMDKVMSSNQSKSKIVILKPSQIIKAPHPLQAQAQLKGMESTQTSKTPSVYSNGKHQKISQSKNTKQLSRKENDTFDYNWDDDTLNANTGEQKPSLKPKLSIKQSISGANTKSDNIQRPYQDNTQFLNSICDSNLNSVRQAVESAQVSIWD